MISNLDQTCKMQGIPQPPPSIDDAAKKKAWNDKHSKRLKSANGWVGDMLPLVVHREDSFTNGLYCNRLFLIWTLKYSRLCHDTNGTAILLYSRPGEQAPRADCHNLHIQDEKMRGIFLKSLTALLQVIWKGKRKKIVDPHQKKLLNALKDTTYRLERSEAQRKEVEIEKDTLKDEVSKLRDDIQILKRGFKTILDRR